MFKVQIAQANKKRRDKTAIESVWTRRVTGLQCCITLPERFDVVVLIVLLIVVDCICLFTFDPVCTRVHEYQVRKCSQHIPKSPPTSL